MTPHAFAPLLAAALAMPLLSQARGVSPSPLQESAFSERRVALVIGNGAYREAPLRNAVQDAEDVAATLRTCGFEVFLVRNADRTQLFDAVRAFGSHIQEGGVGLFYYAGHGMQVKGENYLIPVGTDIRSEDEVPAQALQVSTVLAKMETARNRLNLVILDACRNNPFARSGRSGRQGLAQMDAPAGSLIAYATAPGMTASDGSGRNGLYTQHLLEAMRRPGLPVEQVFKQVRVGVRHGSGDQQVPWESSSLTGEFSFTPGKSGPPAPPPPTALAMTGHVQVNVNAAGTRIRINGIERGTASPAMPLHVKDLPVGDAELHAESPECEPATQKVHIEGNGWTQVKVVLTPRKSSSSSPSTASTVGRIISVQSQANPALFIGHQSGICDLQPGLTDLDRVLTSFRLVPSPVDPTAMSLELLNFPGWYVGYYFQDVRVLQPSGIQERKQISFRIHSLREKEGAVVLESLYAPGYFMVVEGINLKCRSFKPNELPAAASFKVVPARYTQELPPPPELRGLSTISPAGRPQVFLQDAQRTPVFAGIRTAEDHRRASFRIVPGLGDPSAISFEAVAKPGNFLLRCFSEIQLKSDTGQRDYKPGATFRVRPGLGDPRQLSFESIATPGYYLCMVGDALQVRSGNDRAFMTAATFSVTAPGPAPAEAPSPAAPQKANKVVPPKRKR